MSPLPPVGKRESFGAALTYAAINAVAVAHTAEAGCFFSVLSLVMTVAPVVIYFSSKPRPFRRSALILFVLSMAALALANLGLWGEAVAGA